MSEADTTERDAQRLLRLMCDISQRCWCAGWLMGLEYSLWNIVNAGRAVRFGDGEVTPEEVAEMRRLYEACDGWWIWDDEAGEERLVSRDNWLLLLGQRPRTRGER